MIFGPFEKLTFYGAIIMTFRHITRTNNTLVLILTLAGNVADMLQPAGGTIRK
jgi:hypothetical protein